MSICQLHYSSPALQKQTACNVIIPEVPGFSGPYPVFYLLHGLSDDYSMWQRKTSIGRYAQMLPLIIVMPDGGRGFYCDATEGFAYESAIVNDCIGFIDRTFNTRAERAGRCIGGLSMGGYGAIKLALQHPDLFASANGHSGCYGFAHDSWREGESEFARISGPTPIGGKDDVFALASHFKTRRDGVKAPALRIDCGSSDSLIEENRKFHEHLQKMNIAHEYVEFPGAHDWSYWDKHIQSALRFHSKHLGISKPRLRAG